MSQQTSNWTPQQQQGQQQVGQIIGQNISGNAPAYNDGQGRQIAGMTQNERIGQNALRNYIGSSQPVGYSRAQQTAGQLVNPNYATNLTNPNQERGVYNTTMGRVGNDLAATERSNIIDPVATERLMGAIKTETMTDLEDLQNSAANNANLSGMYFSGGHKGMQTDLMKDAAQKLMSTRADLMYSDEQAKRGLEADREARNYQTIADIISAGQGQGYQDISDRRNIDLTAKLEGAGMDLQAAQAQDAADENRIAAASEYGSLPRELEQAQNDAAMEEWMRTVQGNPEAINAMLQYLATQGVSSTTGEQTSHGRNSEGTFNWNLGGSSGL
jgi:hypothetical protein